jgi:hypothetical protein
VDIDRSANPAPDTGEDARPSWLQIILDDVFLLLTLGLVVPTLLYIVWGLMDLASVPSFRP